MAKRRKTADGITGTPLSEPAQQADDLLESIKTVQGIIDDLTTEFNAAVERLRADYEARLKPFKEDLAADDKALTALMKSARKALFDGTDVVYLSNGTLLYTRQDKVSIPRNHEPVIAVCEAHGWNEVVRVAKSLDRDAIEKWPDERLFLIGAQRKTKEEFSYDLKKDTR